MTAFRTQARLPKFVAVNPSGQDLTGFVSDPPVRVGKHGVGPAVRAIACKSASKQPSSAELDIP